MLRPGLATRSLIFSEKYKKAGAENERRVLQSGRKEQRSVISGYTNSECTISKH